MQNKRRGKLREIKGVRYIYYLQTECLTQNYEQFLIADTVKMS